MQPEVSVIIPVYNAAAFIENAVSSVLQQTFSRFELLLIDDGSTDGTGRILQQLQQKDDRIRLFQTEHVGVTGAFNLGLKEACGKYIARLDADDEMLPERLEKQVQFLNQYESVGVVSALIRHGGDPESQKGYAWHIEYINRLITHEDIFLNRFVDAPVANPSVMFRKELAEKFGACREGDFPEDYELWLRFMQNGVRFEKIPEILTIWNDPPTRLTRNDSRYSPDAFNRIKSGYLAEHLKSISGKRKIWYCGAGRVTRNRSSIMLSHEIHNHGYIDVDPAKIGKTFGGKPVISLEMLTGPEENYVVSYINNRGAGENIRNYLKGKGYREGVDFILAG
ncbi:MAG: glycosyltransferase family A protein [Bacteroidia bacterium]